MADLANVDQAILEEVRRDGRISIRTLATTLDIPETTARDRLHKLEQTGVISGYQADVEPSALGADIQAWIIADAPSTERERAAEAIAAEPAVERIHETTDRPDGFAVRVNVPTLEELHQLQARWSNQYMLQIVDQILLSDVEQTGYASTQERDEQNRLLHILKDGF